MGNKSKYETKFSIYKVDSEKVIEDFFQNNSKPTAADMLKAVLNSIEKILKKKDNCLGFSRLKFKKYSGVIFKTVHAPDWKNTLLQMIKNNESTKASSLPDNFISNENVSYVIFKTYNESIYAMTGGYGSFYINKFVESNYGLYLLPKILKKENPVVKNVIENNLTGNRTSTHRTNRSNTSFLTEQDLSSIYKQLNVEIDKSIATEIGIKFDEGESIKKKINLINKDSLVIRRSISLGDLSVILKKLNELENKQDNFALNYLIPAKKKGFKKVDLISQLVNNFKNKIYDAFTLVGDDYESYILNVDIYRIIKDDGSVFMESENPITLEDIFTELSIQGINLTNSFINQFLKKWQVETRDHNGNVVLYPKSIIYTLQGFIEYGISKQPFYLINGNWYVFDNIYSVLLDKEYIELFKYKQEISLIIKKKFNLEKVASNETEYNKKLEKDSDIIVSHTALHQNVEISDAIFWDDKIIYLMHNKNKFDGIGARDLLNQILTAAEYLQRNLTINGSDFLSEYYDQICKIRKMIILPQVSKQEFIQLFTDKKICFIAGYLDGYKKDSDSTYAKYLNIEINKKLCYKGYDFIPMGIH
ncbi:DUF6119 family protein [Sedimentibacter sp.]|uniref:DUF6119 family protein n=1 Tax=Sedimentibacter sp. TaxID=1960295 RepID=UPI0028AD3D81|nr:DUF6119 family protein [Sedimentibacter sp.]